MPRHQATHIAQQEEAILEKSLAKKDNRLLNIGFTVSVLLAVVLLVVYLLEFAANLQGLSMRQIVFYIIAFALLGADAAGCAMLVVFDFNTHLHQAQMAARTTIILLLATIVINIIVSGLQWIELLYLFQVGCIVVFQTRTDELLARNTKFHSPWEMSTDATRRDYIPLNFFNIFWVFVVACVFGLVVEVIYHAIVFGGYQDRAGLLWGPFSPIYGFGAVLMTIALNRYWNRNGFIIFAVAGLIGSAFEFCVSYFMEAAFGVVAWDYTGTFLNIQGRTNFAFFCAWGFLGLVWIKLMLPDVLKLVDAIPLRVRGWATVIFALFMIADGVMTMVTMDCWYQREAGQQPADAVQVFCAEHFDDDYMANRFQSMSMDPSRAERFD